MNRSLTIIFIAFLSGAVSAQFATLKVSKKEQTYTDSLKQVNYDYIFPILGQKTYKEGFDIPYPIGAKQHCSLKTTVLCLIIIYNLNLFS